MRTTIILGVCVCVLGCGGGGSSTGTLAAETAQDAAPVEAASDAGLEAAQWPHDDSGRVILDPSEAGPWDGSVGQAGRCEIQLDPSRTTETTYYACGTPSIAITWYDANGDVVDACDGYQPLTTPCPIGERCSVTYSGTTLDGSCAP